MPDAKPIAVFTDLDGTLLDHATYGYEAALPALAALREQHIPLILCSSKTAAELLPLRAELGFESCVAMVENGAGLLAAGSDAVTPAPCHDELLRILESLPTQLRAGFSGFSDWSQQTLMEHTGLDAARATLAARRDYSEPGLWLGDPAGRAQFIEALGRLGVDAQQGGRFLTLGFRASKAGRMEDAVLAQFGTRPEALIRVALGDAPNDREMLEQANFGYIVPNPAHAGIPHLAGETSGHITRCSQPGPAGWNAAILDLLKRLESETAGVTDG